MRRLQVIGAVSFQTSVARNRARMDDAEPLHSHSGMTDH
jgi:hypothetical protein